MKNLIKVKQCTEEQAIFAKSRIQITTDRKFAVADADLMSESVTENPDLKKKLYSAKDLPRDVFLRALQENGLSGMLMPSYQPTKGAKQ